MTTYGGPEMHAYRLSRGEFGSVENLRPLMEETVYVPPSESWTVELFDLSEPDPDESIYAAALRQFDATK